MLTVSDKVLNGWRNQFPWLIIEGSVNEMRMEFQKCIDCKVVSEWARDGPCNIQRNMHYQNIAAMNTRMQRGKSNYL